MTHRDLLLVANKFSEFATRSGAVTPSQIHALLALPASMLPKKLVVHRGQGLPDLEVDTIIKAVSEADPNGQLWDVSLLQKGGKRAGGHHSHKQKNCNTLIADPSQISEDVFELDLLIDEDCELMNDHQTGQHIQGMVLIEAARQAFLVITEQFFLIDRDQQSYFVINSVGSEFHNFVFPVRAHLIYRVVEKDINQRRQKFDVLIELMQCDKLCMTTRFSFTVYPAAFIAEKERILAKDAVAGAFMAAVQALNMPEGVTAAI